MLVSAGCGALEDPEEGTPPPVNESMNASAPGSGIGATMSFDETTTGGDSTSGTTSGADSTGGTGLDLGIGVLFVGEIAIGDGAWTPPMDCEVRFFSQDQLDPMTGVASEWEASVPITIDAFPYPFMITRNDTSGTTVDFGSEGYIGVRCDFDGDMMLDNVGAFHPTLPAELVTLPVDMVTLELQFL